MLRISLWLAGVLVVTLGLRFVAERAVTTPDKARFLQDAAVLLTESGFTAHVQERLSLDHVLARKGECRLAVASADVGGGNLPAFTAIQPAGSEMRLFYQGREVAGAPRIRPTIEYYAQRHLAAMGVAIRTRPVVMVASLGRCAPGEIDWGKLRLYGAPDQPL